MSVNVYDGQGSTSEQRCEYCRSILSRTAEGQFQYSYLKDGTCHEEGLAGVLGEDLPDVHQNCQFTIDGSRVCSECKPGHALNIRFAMYETSLDENCSTDTECTSLIEGSFFQEVNYPSGITKRFCSSCIQNCYACNANDDCLECSPHSTDMGFGCTCDLAGC
jgi:hypothetical protein